jgi:hypothetical protein
MNRVGFAKEIGNRSSFAVEFQLSDNIPKEWHNWWGNLWLWAGGQLVGNPAETEMVAIGFASLMDTARETEARPRAQIPAQSPKEILDVVMWARYGEDDTRMASLVGDEKRLYPYEVLPGRAGPFFDNWEAVLVEDEGVERFIFREATKQVSEVSWPIGTFRDVVTRAESEFRSLARILLKPPS